jgi:hypothetical protein
MWPVIHSSAIVPSCSVQLYWGPDTQTYIVVLFCTVLSRDILTQFSCDHVLLSDNVLYNSVEICFDWSYFGPLCTVLLHMYAYSFIVMLICTALLKSVLYSYTVLCSCSVLMYSCSVVCSVQLNCGPDQGSIVDTFCTGFYRYNPTHCGHNLYNSVLVLLFTWYNSAAIVILSFMFFPRWLLAMELLWDCYRLGRCWIIRTGDWCIAVRYSTIEPPHLLPESCIKV